MDDMDDGIGSAVAESGGADAGSSVRVAVRLRPQLPREIIDACKICVSKTPGEPQCWLGSNKAFTYDHVYEMESVQEDVYADTVHGLIEGCFEGYNATVLAYGQTGSGKTFTMGTGFELAQVAPHQLGIVPRAVRQLFEGIERRREEARERGLTPPEFKVSTQFMELYNEEIHDLFDNAGGSATAGGGGKNKKSGIRIHEDANGNIYTVGVTSRTVTSEEETVQCLKKGAFNRTTASTNMNDQSSRSHAIFSIYLQQQRQAKAENVFHIEGQETSANPDDFETLSAKFHFVDLAGSERLKRTGATGDRAKEGISINCGLLALGNVISALGDESRKVSHVPYRDSKLTRLLQDSLGGNSRTLMIACVSPSDRDFMETLNTLKYANRARNIRNKVTANQDKTSRTIMMLRQQLQNLQLELMEYRQGKRMVGADGEDTTSDLYQENAMLNKETSNLRTRVKAMQETIDGLTAKNARLLAEKEVGNWMKLSSGAEGEDSPAGADVTAMVQHYIKEIEELRAKLCESEHLCEQLRKEMARVRKVSAQQGLSPAKMAVMNSSFLEKSMMMDASAVMEEEESVSELIAMAKKDVESKKEEASRKKRKMSRANNNEAVTDEDKDADSADDEDDEDDEDEDAVADSDDSDTDTEGSAKDAANNEFNEELVELTSEISLKQKLIEELETSQKRLSAMKHQYENKLLSLQSKIVTTEDERDRVLKNMSSNKTAVGQDKVDKIRKDYKDKLERLQGEVKKLQTAKKEHAKLLRSQGQYERQVDKLKNEVSDMKRAKVRLVQKMKEESNRHRNQEMRRTKEVSQMKKATRKNESRIKALEAEKRMKETVLKRKQEEVEMLRRNQRKASMGARVIGGVRSAGPGGKAFFSEKAAKLRWQQLEKKITKVALNRQAISQMENDMDRWLKDREKLSRKLDRLSVKRRRFAAEKGEQTQLVEDLDDEIENLKANVAYLHENIVDCQQNIVEMEQAGTAEGEDDEINNVSKVLDVGELGLSESHYFLQKLLDMTVNTCCTATQKDAKVRELENRINTITTQSTLHQQLLQHMIEQQDLEVFDLMLGEQGTDDNSEDPDSDEFPLPLPSAAQIVNNLNNIELSEEGGVGSDSSMGRRDKARRRMTTKEDLLFNDMDTPGMNDIRPPAPTAPLSMLTSNGGHANMGPPSLPVGPPPAVAQSRLGVVPFGRSLSFTKPKSEVMMRSRSFVKPGGFGYGMRFNNAGTLSYAGQHHYRANADIMTQSVDPSVISSHLAPVYQPSPVPGRRSHDHQRPTSPRLSLRKYSSAVRLNDEQSPPASPPVFRRTGSSRFAAGGGEDGGGKNVFHRLVAGTKIGEASKPLKGVINPFQGRMAPRSPLICSSIAEGHNKSVLSVCATDELLFSASKDRTVKVWDICRKEEVQSLSGHPNNVNVVKYSQRNRLAFSVSAAFIKVWDLRIGPNASCIKTLSSSGLTTNGPVQLTSANRTLALPPGEALINDIALSESGVNLFSAAADKVRIWDLRKFHSVGKLSGGHQAAVMCLETGPGVDADGDYVITGSKDHYIKVFKVPDGKGGVVTPSMNPEPPHYDGLQNLALSGNTLFSASRDTCIKKWNLNNPEEPLVRSLNNAHKDWVTGLAFLPGSPTVVSGCRAGFLKLWSADTCALMGEMKAHNSPINAIAVNSSHIFSGDNEGSIAFWRVRSNFDKSPDSGDSTS